MVAQRRQVPHSNQTNGAIQSLFSATQLPPIQPAMSDAQSLGTQPRAEFPGSSETLVDEPEELVSTCRDVFVLGTKTPRNLGCWELSHAC